MLKHFFRNIIHVPFTVHGIEDAFVLIEIDERLRLLEIYAKALRNRFRLVVVSRDELTSAMVTFVGRMALYIIYSFALRAYASRTNSVDDRVKSRAKLDDRIDIDRIRELFRLSDRPREAVQNDALSQSVDLG